MRALLLAGLLATGSVTAIRAQVPDTVPDRPPNPEAPIDTTAGPPERPEPGAPAPDTAEAPTLGYDPPRWAVSLGLGTLGFGDLQTQPFLSERLDGLGTVLSSATLTRAVRADGGLQASAAAVYSLSRAWAARIGIAAGRTTIGAHFSGTDDLFVLTASRLADSLDVTAWVVAAEAGLRYRVPAGTRARPYIELGAGALHWGPDPTQAFPELEALWRPTVYAAAGALIPLVGPWQAELRAERRLSRTPAPTAPAGTAGPSSATLRLTAQPGETTAFTDVALELVSELRFEVGLSVGVGTLPPPDPPETAARPSPPGR